MANRARASFLPVGSDRSPARAREDYVKAIYQLGADGPVRAAALARYLKVSRVSVSKAKRLLGNRRACWSAEATPSQPLRLSGRGYKLAIAMVRRHRLLETFLHRSLRVPLERVHAEAERIEHVDLRRRRVAHRRVAGAPAIRPARPSDSVRRRGAAAQAAPDVWRASPWAAGSRREPRRPRRRSRRGARRGRQCFPARRCASSATSAAECSCAAESASFCVASPSRRNGAHCNVATASGRAAPHVVAAARDVLAGNRRGLRALLPFAGPAFVASVAYMDPGNFATNIQGGAGFGYRLLWVVVLANLHGDALSRPLGQARHRDRKESRRALARARAQTGRAGDVGRQRVRRDGDRSRGVSRRRSSGSICSSTFRCSIGAIITGDRDVCDPRAASLRLSHDGNADRLAGRNNRRLLRRRNAARETELEPGALSLGRAVARRTRRAFCSPSASSARP